MRPAFAGHGLGDGTPGGRQQDAGSLWRIGEQSASGGGLRATRGHTLSATRGPGHRSSPAGSQSGSSCFPCPFYASEMSACPGRTQVSATTRRPYANPESHRPHGSSFHAVNGDWIALDRVAAAGHFGDDASHGSRWTARRPTPVKSPPSTGSAPRALCVYSILPTTTPHNTHLQPRPADVILQGSERPGPGAHQLGPS